MKKNNFALMRAGANAIYEKPLVLNPWNADALVSLEKETGREVYTILHHPQIMELKKKSSRFIELENANVQCLL